MTSLVTPTNQRPSVDQNMAGFRLWLTNKNYSSSTIRNYLSDIGNYFESVENCKLKIENSNLFSSDTVSVYLKIIQSDSNYSRYLSSLSKFFQFALDQGLTKTNPLKSALKDKKPSLDEIINQYSDFLNKKNFSESTVRNYLNDIRQFTDWSSNQLNPPVDKSTSSLKEGGSLKTAPFVKGSCPEQSEGLRGFKFFKSIFRKKEVSSESQ